MSPDQMASIIAEIRADVDWNQKVLAFIVALLFLTIAATITVWWQVPYLLRKIGVMVGLAETNARLADHSKTCAVKAVEQATFELKNTIANAAGGLSMQATETSQAAAVAAIKVGEVIETLRQSGGVSSDKPTT